ncbi:MAG: L,D-transpeptidase family protein [Ferruginibacter sp.]
MRNVAFKFFSLLFCATLVAAFSFAQSPYVNVQKVSYKSPDGVSRMEDSVKKQFEKQHLTWPPESMYIRSFKFDRQLEVWVKGAAKEPYKLFKIYKVCTQSGTTGPKRAEGDYQVPEGFYYINEFNPNSNYHLALGLNYPNASDRILSDSLRPGNAIYIHGNCVSTGCIPITDMPIEELYVIASNVKAQGEEFIPVHVFPVRYNVKKSMEYLNTSIKDKPSLQQFNANIKEVFDYFEAKKQLPIIMVNKKGEYVLN